MGQQKIYELLNKHKYTLTESEYIVLYYYEEHFHEAIKLSIKGIASVTNCSTSSIFRMCQKFGYEGFSDFKHSLKNVDSVKSLNTNNQHIGTRVTHYCDNSQQLQNIDIMEFSEVVNLIVNSKNIGILARGYSSIVAKYMEFHLRQTGKQISMIDSDAPGGVFINYLNNVDLIIVISNSGNVEQHMSKLNFAKRKNKPICLLTASKKYDKQVIDKSFTVPTLTQGSVDDFVANAIATINLII